MRDPCAASPVPRRRAVRAERGGLLGHLAVPRPASRLRQPRRLPRGLDAAETAALLDSFGCWRLFPVTQNEHVGDVQDEHVEPDIPGVYPAVRAHGGGVLLTVSRRAALAASSWSW